MCNYNYNYDYQGIFENDIDDIFMKDKSYSIFFMNCEIPNDGLYSLELLLLNSDYYILNDNDYFNLNYNTYNYTYTYTYNIPYSKYIKTKIENNFNILMNILTYKYKYIYNNFILFEYMYLCNMNDDYYKRHIKKFLLLNKINEKLKLNDEEYFKYVAWILNHFKLDFNLLKYFIKKIIINNNKKYILKLIHFIFYSIKFNKKHNIRLNFDKFNIIILYFIYYYTKKYMFKIYKIYDIYSSCVNSILYWIYDKSEIKIIHKLIDKIKININIYIMLDLRFTFLYLIK